ncbi:hypothetical protein J7T55_000468, partial [Diaporthe amygdali]|uniref:uncharacterized protein n=1 Tax=Phomopsis amygdali TaxID=1214568 RepID=UPI0022FF2B8A
MNIGTIKEAVTFCRLGEAVVHQMTLDDQGTQDSMGTFAEAAKLKGKLMHVYPKAFANIRKLQLWFVDRHDTLTSSLMIRDISPGNCRRASGNMKFPEHEFPPEELVTDQLETSSLDDRSYHVIRLPNQLEALLIHDGDADKASAAINVNVGNFSDKVDMPGLAHAVEHVLLMGTKKYPEENAYTKYISSHSGQYNASTTSTSTMFYFNIAGLPSDGSEPSANNPSPLKGALDHLAQFFIQPIFLESTIDRELMAVDSEDKRNLQHDEDRLEKLSQSLSNPDHPYFHSATGNLKVLKSAPEARGVNVRQEFIRFYEMHYSANRMKLVVLGREPLDVLRSWVTEYFTDVQDKKLKPNRWNTIPLGPEYLQLRIFAKPVKNSKSLFVYFPFMDEEELFESRPSLYITHLIGHEGPGSIMSHIKSKGWANSLCAIFQPVCPGSPAVIKLEVELTEDGLRNHEEIVKILFQYLALLREAPPQEWVFDELRSMADVNFRFEEKTPVMNFTKNLSSVMQRPLPREWLLSGLIRLRKFEPELIRQGIDYLRPENLRMFIISRPTLQQCDKKEEWYGTEYKCEKISSDFMEELKQVASCSPAERVSALHLPNKNQFIPNNFEVERKEVKEPAVAPTMIRNDGHARTWYKKDDRFWVPKANLLVSCRNPIIFASAENYVKAQLFTNLVKDALEEYSYDASLAGLQYSVSLDKRGLVIKVGGYNNKISVLLERVLETIRGLDIQEDHFERIKECLSRSYQNWGFGHPYDQVEEYTTWLNTEHDFLVEHYNDELDTITCEATRTFQKEVLSQMHMEVLVHGNLYKEDALKLTSMLENKVQTRALPSLQWPISRSLLFPPGSNYVYRKMLSDPANLNHCIEYWLYIGQKDERMARAKVVLLEQILYEPVFNQLRTKEQLGYAVFIDMKNSATTLGFRILIQSEKTAQYLEIRIEEFLSKYTQTLEEMSDAGFKGHKDSLINKLLEKLKNLDEETNS